MPLPKLARLAEPWLAALLAASVASAPALAQSAAGAGAEIRALRDEIGAIRAAYEARLQALELRLQAAEAAAAAARTAAASAPTASPVAPAPAVAQSAASGGTPAAAGAFNPAISLILSGLYANATRDPAAYALAGIQLPAGAAGGAGTRGFSLAESELGLAASIDPWLRGAANIALHPDDTVSVEEAYVQTTALDFGLTLKAGRFFSGVGYLNSQHAHTWDFVDSPLAYQAFLGSQYGDDGVQLSWLAPTDLYLELGAELGRGRGFPGSDSSRNGAGMTALTLHGGGDIGDSSNWRAGVSVLNAKADDLATTGLRADGSTVAGAFSGSTRVWLLDGVWKWAPQGNATRTSFKLQGEYLRSDARGTLVYAPFGNSSAGGYRVVQSGWYLQGIYQFMPRWRIGLRTERLDPGSPDYGADTGLYAGSGYRPSKNSLMVDFSASEFSRVRLQLADDRSRAGLADRQFMIQYQMSLGAHGAHSY